MALLSTLKLGLQKIGMSKAIAYITGTSLLSSVFGVVSVYFICRFLSGEEQGYYYTFNNILALKIFFELGLTGIISQFVAHEHAHLLWKSDGISLTGEEKYMSRLSSLIHFCVKWYSILAILFFIVISIAGYIFFLVNEKDLNIEWKLPWIFLTLCTAISLFNAPFEAIIFGLDKVKEISKINFAGQFITPLVCWTTYILGFKLYVIVFASVATLMLQYFMYWRFDFIKILYKIWLHPVTERISYRYEILPYQWRIAVSWMGGYFIYELFNPVLFATQGAKVAGQMGMTLNILNQIRNLSLSWCSTKIPHFSRLIEKKEYPKLDNILKTTLWQEYFVCSSILAAFAFVVYMMGYCDLTFSGNRVADRFLPMLPMFLMMIPILCDLYTATVATYLRCHKKEPFLYQSVTCAALIACSTFIWGKMYGLYGICIGYACIVLFIGTPWAYYIFTTKKKEWHS